MHLILLLAASLFAIPLLGQQNYDVLHYKYELELGDRSDTVKGKATISVKLLSPADSILMDFDVVHAGDTKGMLVKGGNGTMARALGNDRVGFYFPTRQRSGDTIQLQLEYSGIPVDGLIISKNRHGDRTFFSDNWPNRAHHWIPCNDRPDDKASFEFIVTAPAHYRVISNGILVSEASATNGMKRTHWKNIIPLPTKVMVIGVARFAVKQYEQMPQQIPVSAWIFPQDSTQGFHDYAAAPSILDFFIRYIGPYPFEKLANVQSKTRFGGMENAGAIFYNENSVNGKATVEDLLAHEIVHQWFGDMASEKAFTHLWLSEGFATYLTNVYLDAKHGRQVMRERMRKEREQILAFTGVHTKPVVDSISSYMELLNENSYQKGGWVLHMLRLEVGDSLFQKIIQLYYDRYKGSNADTRDFEKLVEEVAGRELTWFFDQWLYRPGLPQLIIQKRTVKEGLQLTVVQVQKELFRFQLPVYVKSKGSGAKTFYPVNGDRITNILISGDKAAEVVVDPDVELLWEEAKK